MKKTEEKCWIDILEPEFSHPAIILWRAAEARFIAEALERHLPLDPILDLGCAEGKIADALFEGKRIYGLDNCWDLIHQNERKDRYRELFLADGCFMPFKERAFQTVFSNCVIEHIPDLDKLLSEVSRVLNKGGKFIFTVPSDKFGEYLLFSVLFRNIGLATLAKSYATFRNRTLCHFHCFSHDIWVDRLKKYNLKTINYAYYMPKRSTMFWDFLAAAIFLFNRLGASKNIERRLTLIFKKKLHKYANLDNERGAGLLIVASKI